MKTLSISFLQPWNQKDLCGCLKGKWQRIICMRYTYFYDDGDRKSFSEVKNTYPGIQVQERECIGHDQKRLGMHSEN